MTNNSTPSSGPLSSAEHVLLGHIQLPASTTTAQGPAPTMIPGRNSVAPIMSPSGLSPTQSTAATVMLPSVMDHAQMSSQVTNTTLRTPIRRLARRLSNAEPSSHEPSAAICTLGLLSLLCPFHLYLLNKVWALLHIALMLQMYQFQN
ncbi:hypothetical protein MRB53_028724 [Persea americana]|uniref:Uncharacterized protein n=1 Tax=Persea americana TaxID=3435 RepID=A0ACC2KGC0_PERAE|nr:hypothetical protein MRB53_028724 [Persea americana]